MISLNYQDAPLKYVIETFRDMTGINVVVDREALEAACVDYERQCVSLRVENIALKSALNLLLWQANLTFVIRDEVVLVTTKEGAAGKLRTVTYPVADLVTPIDGQFVSMFYSDGIRAMYIPTRPPAEKALINLITAAVQPATWGEVGGQGTIQYYPLGLALVVNQTADVHEEVAVFLAALRKLHAAEFRQYLVGIRLLETHGADEPCVLMSPQLAVTLGQTAMVRVGQEIPMRSYTVADLIGAQDAPLSGGTIPVGKSVQAQLRCGPDGAFRLDLTYTEQEVAHAGKDGVDVGGSTHRFLRPVELGKVVKLPLQRDDSGTLRRWLEVTVTVAPGAP
jgi:hypothetical protein